MNADQTWQTFDCRTEPAAAIAAARAAVQAGECIVLPTDTVYGIGANALDAAAVQRLLDAKERGRDMPPPVLIAEPALLASLAADVTEAAATLADAFWPGALTLVVRAQHSLLMELGDRGSTIAVRVPNHDFTRSLLRRTGPLAVSSANVSGKPAAMSVAGAQSQLGARVSVYIDGGLCANEVPSTIIDVTRDRHAVVLRQGRLSLQDLRAAWPDLQGVAEATAPVAKPADSGMAAEPAAEGESAPGSGPDEAESR